MVVCVFENASVDALVCPKGVSHIFCPGDSHSRKPLQGWYTHPLILLHITRLCTHKSNYFGSVAMTFGTDIQGAQRMNPDDIFVNHWLLIFAPSSGNFCCVWVFFLIFCVVSLADAYCNLNCTFHKRTKDSSRQSQMPSYCRALWQDLLLHRSHFCGVEFTPWIMLSGNFSFFK